MSVYQKSCIVGPDWANETTLIRRTSKVVKDYDSEKTKAVPSQQKRSWGTTPNTLGITSTSLFSKIFELVGEGLVEESVETLAKQEATQMAISKDVRAFSMQQEARRVCNDHTSFLEFKQSLKESKTKTHDGVTPQMYMRQLADRHHRVPSSHQSAPSNLTVLDLKQAMSEIVTTQAHDGETSQMGQKPSRRCLSMQHTSSYQTSSIREERTLWESRRAERKASMS